MHFILKIIDGHFIEEELDQLRRRSSLQR